MEPTEVQKRLKDIAAKRGDNYSNLVYLIARGRLAATILRGKGEPQPNFIMDTVDMCIRSYAKAVGLGDAVNAEEAIKEADDLISLLKEEQANGET